MRLTTYSLPATDELANTSQLPIALIVQPFAQQRLDEAPVPVVECGPSGPPRCKRCRAYINPWAIFVEGGQKWVCNLCGTATDVAADYFCHLDMGGRRVDFDDRPELSKGTVEFRVPKEYWAIQSAPPASLLLPVAPALTLTETAKLAPSDTANGEEFNGTTMGLTGQSGQAARAATKAASEALSSTLNVGQGRTTVRAPRPMTYFFAIDVSFSAVRSGSLKACVEGIRETIYGPREGEEKKENGADAGAPGSQEEPVTGPGFGLPHGSRVAILTFDRSLHFYNLLPELETAQMLVVADIDDPFVPISEGLLADPWESRSVVEGLLDNIPSLFADNTASEAALGAVVRGVQATLSTIGGQANVFLSTIPTIGPGSLKHREDTKLYGTDKEKTLFAAQDGWYRGVAEECVDAGIGFNIFFFPSQYIDVATIGTLSGITGGELYFHPRFDPVRDGDKLDAQIRRAILRESGYNSTMRIRCSNGLHVTEHFGNFFQRNTTDLELANIDADKAVAALVKHEGKLDEKQEAHFQCAILYTTASGERRVRCHNIAVPVTSLLGNVFRYADMDSTVAYFMKEGE
jgi:protein transport protein SEC24